ncbi:MAG: 30S ribosomal protein S12 methylthiotransferase RimO [Bacteroidaceae bacterium]|nr:30S ribosomal protein S12 methylthiotransferase RimO [Bacteroidaceae bacterium]
MKRNRVDIVSLGCSKNLVDSERLMHRFAEAGYEVFHDAEKVSGEIVVVNTCGFIGDAKEESIEMILQLADAKKRRRIGKLFVMGCLSERYREELTAEIPEVDKFYGKFDWENLLADLGRPEVVCSTERILTTPSHYAYIKIAEGCNRFCSYCAIPLITGRFKSYPMEQILDEVRSLVAKGVKEFQVIAQDLSYYGEDLYGENRLAQLIGQMAQIEGVEWIRLHYAYPAGFPYDLLPVMARHDNVCKYLDIALQHISDNMLDKMLRHVTKQETYDLLARIRREVPGIHLRTTLMVGHPGETEADFEELLQFVRDARFERMGAFAYCEEEGTYAARHYADDIPEEVKQNRLDRLMALQEEIAADINAAKHDTILRVLVDREDPDYYVGRTQYDSPEVDNEVLIEKTRSLSVGEFCEVKVVETLPFDLIARPL